MFWGSGISPTSATLTFRMKPLNSIFEGLSNGATLKSGASTVAELFTVEDFGTVCSVLFRVFRVIVPEMSNGPRKMTKYQPTVQNRIVDICAHL